MTLQIRFFILIARVADRTPAIAVPHSPTVLTGRAASTGCLCGAVLYWDSLGQWSTWSLTSTIASNHVQGN